MSLTTSSRSTLGSVQLMRFLCSLISTVNCIKWKGQQINPIAVRRFEDGQNGLHIVGKGCQTYPINHYASVMVL